MKKLSKIIIITVLSVFLVAGTAMAIPTLELSDGINTITIYDEGSFTGPNNPADAWEGPGAVSYLGTLGNFNLNVTTGVTKPFIGETYYPMLDLNSINVSSSSEGKLIIKWTDTGFITLPDTLSGFNSFIGGTTTGTVTLDTYLDESNTAFGMGTPLSSLGPFSLMAFSDEYQMAINPADPFSLTIVATITHEADSNLTSFDAGISPAPEPATMLLLGSGLIGLARFGRKKMLFKKG